MRRLLVLIVVLCARSVAAQSTCTGGGCTPIERWDCSGGAYPLCGADAVRSESFFTRSNLGAVGPNGETVVRVTHTGQTDTSSGSEYFVNDWEWTVPSVTQGQCRYHRLRWRVRPPVSWVDNDGARFGVKFIFQGTDGAFDANRFIANFRSDLDAGGDLEVPPTQVLMRSEKNVEGGNSRVDIHDLVDTSESPNGWHHWQFEICSSSTAGSSDGTQKVWRNNNVYASPSGQGAGGFNWPTQDWSRIALDVYSESIAPSGNGVYDIAAYEYDDQFRTDWYTEGGGGGGGPPVYRFRFRTAIDTPGAGIDRGDGVTRAPLPLATRGPGAGAGRGPVLSGSVSFSGAGWGSEYRPWSHPSAAIDRRRLTPSSRRVRTTRQRRSARRRLPTAASQRAWCEQVFSWSPRRSTATRLTSSGPP